MIAASVLGVLVPCGGPFVSNVSAVAEAPHEDAVLFDGSAWYRGVDYKAGFTEEGASFVPFLGSAAPRNFPVRFTLCEAQIGGVALQVRQDAPPEFGDRVVRFDRGAVVEEYRLEPRSVEQVFVIDELPATGDLVLRISIETELAASERAGGVELTGGWGGVRYGRATAFDARGEFAQAPARLVDGAIELRFARSELARARGPLTIDPLITTFAIDHSPPDDRRPEIEYDASLGVYALVWERTFSMSDHDVHGRLLDEQGGTVQDFVLAITPISMTVPNVAGIDALDQFLVMYGTSVARIVDLAGGGFALGPPINYFGTGLGTGQNHAIGGDAGSSPPFYYLAVVSLGDGTHLVYRLIRPDGGALPVHDLTDWPSHDTSRARPAVSKVAVDSPGTPRRWAVTYLKGGDLGFGIGAFLFTNQETTGPEFDVVTEGAEQTAVSPVLEGAEADLPYLITWDTLQPRQYRRVRALLVRGSGPAGAVFDVSSPYGVEPSVDSDGASFVVAYAETTASGHLARASTYGLDGTAPSGLVRTETSALSHEGSVEHPAVASTHKLGGARQHFLAAWCNFGAGQGDLDGALYDTPGPGTRYCSTAPNSVGAGARIGSAGGISIALEDFELRVDGCPPGTLGLFYLGLNRIQFPFGDGFRCIGGATRRIAPILATDAAGHASLVLDFEEPYGELVDPGPPGVNFQFWYRDPAGGPAHFNLSDALHVEFLP